MKFSDNERQRIYESIMSNVKKTLNKIINESFLPDNKPDGYWNNYEHCKQAASECKNRTEFARKYYRAYIISMDYGWNDEFFGKLKHPGANWYGTFSHVQAEAVKYRTERDFEKYSPNAYKAALNNGWLKRLYPDEFNDLYNDDRYDEYVDEPKSNINISDYFDTLDHPGDDDEPYFKQRKKEKEWERQHSQYKSPNWNVSQA